MTLLSPGQALHWLAQRAARRYVAGASVQEALQVQSALHRRGFRATLGYWDSSRDTPGDVITHYQTALHAIESSGKPGYLSIKAWAFGFDAAHFRQLSVLSARLAIPLHCDAGPPETAQATFELLAANRTGAAPRPGCTLPARWRRSLEDARWAASRGLSVRVVKGQWPDTAKEAHDLRRNFLAIVEQLAPAGACVRVATHDYPLAAAALHRLKAAGAACELELLYGLPGDALIPLARQLKVPIRFYIPYGHGYLPYALQALRRNPRIFGRLMCDALLPGRLRGGHASGAADTA